MTTTRASLVSEADFLSLPESLERVELIDGEMIVSPSPTVWHQEILRRIVFALGGWLGADPDRRAFLGQAPLDVRFGAARILQPDAFVVLGDVSLDHLGPIDRIPEICIEVLSSNRAYDRLTKRRVLAEAGVQEYWLIEPEGLIERWSGPGLSVSEEITDRLTSALLPGFELAIDGLFRR